MASDPHQSVVGDVTAATPAAPASPVIQATAASKEAAVRPRSTPAAPPPPPRRQGILGWLGLLLCLALAAPPLLLDLTQPDVTDVAEARSITTATHTLERWQKYGTLLMPLAVDPLVPVYNGNKLWRQPPGTVWAQMAALGTADRLGRLKSPHDAIRWTRLQSAVFALLIVTCTYWAAQSLGGVTAAILAGLLCAASPWLVLHGRAATEPIHGTMWLTLSVAAALWATRPLKPSPSLIRQAAGWGLCGFAWAMAIFCLGPEAVILIGLPVFVMLVMCPNRVGHLLGLLAALMLGVLLAMPWAVFVQSKDPDAWRAMVSVWGTFADPFTQGGAGLAMVGQRARSFFFMTLPWTLWAVVALIQPVSTSSAGSRVRLFLGSVWFFCLGFLLLVLPHGEIERNLLPIVPAMAVLIGQLFAQYHDLATVGHYTKSWRLLRWVYPALTMILSIGVPTLLLSHAWPGPRTFTELPAFNLDMTLALGLMVALLAIWALSVRWTFRHFPALALASWAVWLLVLLTSWIVPWSRQPDRLNPLRAEMQAMSQLVGSSPLMWLARENETDPRADVLLYTHRAIPPILPGQFNDAVAEHPDMYVLGPTDHHKCLTPVMKLPSADLTLYRLRREVPTTTPSISNSTSTAPADVSLRH